METDSQTAKKSEDLKKATVGAEYKKRDAIWPLVLFYINLYALGTYSIYVTVTAASWTTIFFSEFDRLLSFWSGLKEGSIGEQAMGLAINLSMTKCDIARVA